MTIRVPRLILSLLGMPALYAALAYACLVSTHGRVWLMDTCVHENGRLTLAGTLFYFDHFLGGLPMILLFALCAAGGFALGARAPGPVSSPRARSLALNLLVPLPALLGLVFLAAVRVAGWERTRAYA